MVTTEFDEIRPYHDEEVKDVLKDLLADPEFQKIAKIAFSDIPFEALSQIILSCETKHDFQVHIAYKLLTNLINKFTAGVTLGGSELISKTGAYTYVSNHRDIVLDSGFLSVLLHNEGIDTVEIAIGDNLLVYPWIKKLVRVNKSFIVQRALSMRQMLESSARMSRYMHYTIKEKKQSIWIAQREGRAKDSDDRTQESVLKMFAMGGEGEIIDRLIEMNIVPLSLSYEYDPCDYLKAREFQLKRDNPDYRKTQEDDLLNMQTGLIGYKGRVHFHIAGCINNQLSQLDRGIPKTEIFGRVSSLIDTQIHKNYRMYPGNYIACDLLNNSTEFSSHYSRKEKLHFEGYVHNQLNMIDLPEKDIPFLYEKILLMYANPLKNYIAAKATEL